MRPNYTGHTKTTNTYNTRRINMDFESLKKSSSNFDAITKALETKLAPEDQSNKNKYQDDRLWKPELDKTGNGYAVIRFLPASNGEEMPWQRVWTHAFQDKGGWFIENSLTTLNQKDPVSEENTRLWNTGVDSDKEIARKRKRKLSYYSNIYVVSDPKHPENEGKVFLFKFGKKIFDKITEAMNPEFADEVPVNPFDLWDGANFKLKIRNVEGYRNYDKSEFADKEPVMGGDDDKLENLWKQEYSLKEFLEEKNFKSYDVLKARLDKVLGFEGEVAPRTTAEDAVVEAVSPSNYELDSGLSQVDAAIASDGDDDLDYFKNLAEG